MKTPLRDPFTSKAATVLTDLIPPLSKVNFFNLFSGFLELSLCDDRVVVANTNRYVVYEFWKCMQEDPMRLADSVDFLNSRGAIAPYTIELLQKKWAFYENPYLRAALFFVLNHSSENGTVSTGNYNQKTLSPFALSGLRKTDASKIYLNFYDKLELLDFNFKDLNSDFVVIPIGRFSYNLFEHGEYSGLEEVQINHRQVRTFLDSARHKTILLYEMHPSLPAFYKEHEMRYLDVYGRFTDDHSKAREVIVANFGIS